MGKAWARGLTEATDERIARNAAAHRGLQYVRRTPIEQCKWPVREPRVQCVWSPNLAYAVGLIATDGCLASTKSVITLVSKDKDLLRTYLACLGRGGRIAPHGDGSAACRVQFNDASFYRWLMSIGVTPRKSLTLAAIEVPDEHLLSLVRGLLDGDGSITYETVVPNPRTYPLHWYPRIGVRFHSASYAHLDWLRARLSREFGLTGAILVDQTRGGNPMYALKYAKHASKALLSALYRDPDAPRLERKREIWQRYLAEGRQTRIWTRRSTPTVEGADSRPA